MKKIKCKAFLIITILIIYYLTFNIENCSAQWVQMSNGIGNNISVHSFTTLGSNIIAGTSAGVFITDNNGAGWTQTQLNYNVISLASLGNIIFAGTSNNGVFLSSDNGANWTQSPIGGVKSFAVSGNLIFAGTSYGVNRSTNNGTNWTQVLSAYNLDVYSLGAPASYIVAGTIFGVYLGFNSGLNWSQIGLSNQIIYSLAFNGLNIFACTFNNGVYFSSDNGTHWAQIGLGNQTIYSLAISGNNIIAGTDSYGVCLSPDVGTNWFNKNQGFSTNLRVNAFIIGNNFLFAGTENNSVWRRSVTEIIGIKQISENVPSEYSLSQNYPNPFNPATKIKFNIPPFEGGKGGMTVLKVYDILGKEIETLVNEKLIAGTYEVTFSRSNYPSGVYLYSLTTNGFSETKKMLMIK